MERIEEKDLNPINLKYNDIQKIPDLESKNHQRHCFGVIRGTIDESQN